MTNQSPIKHDADDGFLLRIAGKALALASVAALSLPLLAFGQAAGVVPGGLQSDHYATLDSLAAAFNRPAVTQTIDDVGIAIPVGTFQEHFSGNLYSYRENKVTDTAIGLYGVIGGLAGAGVMGAAGSAFANASSGRAGRREERIGYDNAKVDTKGLGLLGGLVAVDMIDGQASDASKAVAAGIVLAAAAAAVAVPTYLSGKSVYDNFIRDNNPALPAAKSAMKPV